MTPYECETYINFNNAEKEAVLCTYNTTWLRKMDAMANEFSEFKVQKREENYGEYIFPKKYLLIRKPRFLSDEKKKECGERMKKYWEEKKNAE